MTKERKNEILNIMFFRGVVTDDPMEGAEECLHPMTEEDRRWADARKVEVEEIIDRAYEQLSSIVETTVF